MMFSCRVKTIQIQKIEHGSMNTTYELAEKEEKKLSATPKQHILATVTKGIAELSEKKKKKRK